MKFIFIIGIFFFGLYGDDLRPAYLEVKEIKASHYALLFKTPKASEKKGVDLSLDLPKSFKIYSKTLGSMGRYDFMKLEFTSASSLDGKVITIKNLNKTSIELITKLEFLDGSTSIKRVLPESGAFIIRHKTGFLNVMYSYLDLGIYHILLGFDHLLFVLALVLLIQDRKTLIYAITAFTVAHSLTLILASLELISISNVLVESLIALSIVFIAAEVVYDVRGKQYLAKRYPWLIAAFFGLIHGLGFASVLKEVGLASSEIIPSLLFFNLGVEIGQLLFITLLLLTFLLIEKLFRFSLEQYRLWLSYIIGTVAAFWFLQRIFAV